MKTEMVARTGLVKAGLLKFKPLPKLDEIDPGIDPHEFNVLVLQREIEDKTASGLLHLPQQNLDREQDAAVDGMLARLSPAAFSYAEYPPECARPKAGDLVVFRRYAGVLVEGDDGRKYRLMADKDIIAVRRTEKLETEGAW